MHEFSLIKDLMRKIKMIADEQRAARVVSVRVQLGSLAHISADHFREHFEAAAAGTAAEGAQLDIATPQNDQDPHAQDILLQSVEVEA
jgi:hydrogenase nickel incorporation protein HypA/HybF